MHDPHTVAFNIKVPWYGREFPVLGTPRCIYWKCIGTIWHVDPETDGTDDSCRWFHPRLNDEDEKLIDSLARNETHAAYFTSLPSRINNPRYPSLRTAYPGDVLAFTLELFRIFAWRLERRDQLSTKEINCAISLALCEVDNVQHVFAYDKERSREENARNLFQVALTSWRRCRRPWYRHPRWHVWHWQVQIYAVGHLKRWLFSRCAECGRRFPYGYAPTSTCWDSPGPRWFRGEECVYHSECLPVPTRVQKEGERK